MQTKEVDFCEKVYNDSDIEKKVVRMLAKIFRGMLGLKR